MSSLLNWNDSHYIGGSGVITGCDERQEWMLKWWWDNYSKQNAFPVTFFDYGMSTSARLWCEKRGHVIPFTLPPSLAINKEDVPINTKWHDTLSDYIWNRRNVWFTKAFSLLHTPYDKSLWIDLDCEVKKPIDPLFDFCEEGDGFAVTYNVDHADVDWKKRGILLPHEKGYQVGVFSYKRKSPVIDKWLEDCYQNHKQEFTEQSSLSHAIHKGKFQIFIFSNIYNWLEPDLEMPEIAIVHHVGSLLKRKLFSQIKVEAINGKTKRSPQVERQTLHRRRRSHHRV